MRPAQMSRQSSNTHLRPELSLPSLPPPAQSSSVLKPSRSIFREITSDNTFSRKLPKPHHTALAVGRIRSVALRRQRSHARIVSGAPVLSVACTFSWPLSRFCPDMTERLDEHVKGMELRGDLRKNSLFLIGCD